MGFFKNTTQRKNEPRLGDGEFEHKENPFLGEAGRKEWNDRYGAMAKNIRGWQGAFGLAMLLVAILAIVNVKLSSQSHIQPFAVELNQGVPVAIQPMSSIDVTNPQIVAFFIEHFIENARTVVSDTEAEKNMLNGVYAFAADKTLPFLKEYYTANNPLERAQTQTVTVHVINILPLSTKTFQIIWEETARQSMNGEIIGKTRWIAHLTYQKTGKVNPLHAKENPFGLYITQLTWSQSQEGA